MELNRPWVIGILAVGAAAAVAAAALFWLIMTQPVRAAALVGGGF